MNLRKNKKIFSEISNSGSVWWIAQWMSQKMSHIFRIIKATSDTGVKIWLAPLQSTLWYKLVVKVFFSVFLTFDTMGVWRLADLRTHHGKQSYLHLGPESLWYQGKTPLQSEESIQRVSNSTQRVCPVLPIMCVCQWKGHVSIRTTQ